MSNQYGSGNFAVNSLTRLKLPPVVAFGVQDAEDNYAVAFDAVEYFIGKTAREQTAKTIVINWLAFRLFLQQTNCTSDCIHQFIAQTGTLCVIP